MAPCNATGKHFAPQHCTLSDGLACVIVGWNRDLIVRFSLALFCFVLFVRQLPPRVQAEQLIGALVSECKSRDLGSELTEVREVC